MSDITVSGTPDRPLRKDAERNRRRILDAARELFAQRGLSATLNDVAHHAGVGVGTVYRRFPDKSQLIEALFEDRVAQLVGSLQEAIADPDPWHGMVGFLEHMGETQAHDRAMQQILSGTPDGLERIARIREQLLPLGEQLVRRAQDAGQLHEDIAPTDLPIIQLMLASVIDASRDVEPELWRRYLDLLIRGVAARPAAANPLRGEPPPPESVDAVMAARKLAR